jgi:hypothetical protein
MVWRTGGDFNFISFHFPFLFSHEMETQLKKKNEGKKINTNQEKVQYGC